MKIKLSIYYEAGKAIIFIAFIAFIVFLGLRAYHWINTKYDNRLEQIRMELEVDRQKYELEINEIRAKTEIVNEGSDAWESEIVVLKKENTAMMELIKKSGEEVKNIGTITAGVNENLSLVLKAQSDHSYKQGSGDPEEQYFKKIMAAEKDKDGTEISIPWAWSIYYPNKKEWKTGIYPLEYKAKVIQTEQKDGQWNTYIEAWAENNQGRESRGLRLPLKVDAEFRQTTRTLTEFYWWAPHVSLNLDINNELEIGAGISFSFSGYGRTKNDLTWKFLELGISGNEQEYWVKFSPAAYNIGRILPVINNTFLSPFIGRDRSRYMGGISLNVPF